MARMTVVAAEPPLATAAALHAEHVEAANRVGNGLHRHYRIGALRLVLELQTKLGANFGRTQIQTKFIRTLADVCEAGPSLEA